MKRHVTCLLLAGSLTALAQPATRSEVQAQRAAIEQRFAREQAECERRFVVSACLEDLQQRRREALAPLVAREHELAAEERRERAAAQAQRVKEREQAAAQDEGQRRERLVPAPAVPASHPVRARSPEQAVQAQRLAEQKAEEEAAKRREQARERELRQQQRIAEHAERQKRRTKPPAAPLPLPGAAPTSAASR